MTGLTQAEYLSLQPEAAIPTFRGERSDKGRIAIGKRFANEGYAVLACGNTEVEISYSLLARLHIMIDPMSAAFSDLCDLQRAFNSIICEASLGRNGDR
jgi:hypothetical protein